MGKRVVDRRDVLRYGVNKDRVVREYVTVSTVRYPYERWTSRPVQVLYRGRDYSLESKRMAQVIRNWCNKNGVEVSFSVDDHAIVVSNWSRIKPYKRSKA